MIENIKYIKHKLSLLENSEIVNEIHAKIDDIYDILEFADENEKIEISNNIIEIKKQVDKEFYEKYFIDEDDKKACFLEINCGVGGYDAHQCTQMIMDMYTKWAIKNNKKHNFVSIANTDYGIRSCSIMFNFNYAYGIMKFEQGVHRIIRISPFNKKRQTSFVSVYVYPKHDKKEIDIPVSDMRIETMRSSGAGGQHVNTTDSAVRITHIPTGITASCQNNRSQLRNKEEAINILYSKIKQNTQEENLKDSSIQGKWGMQIRTYTMNPYQKVKDHRTNFESSKIDNILSGDIDDILEYRFNNKNIF